MRDPDKKNQERMESYPRPTKTDEQLQNQVEYIEEQPNKFSDNEGPAENESADETSDKEYGGEG